MTTELRFDGRVAIVTGAGRGLGRAHALLLAQRGARVLVNDPGGSLRGEGEDTRPADAVVAEIQAAGGDAHANYDSVVDGEKIVAAALDAFGQIDIIINNAGVLRDVSFHKMTHSDWDTVYQVHLQGAYRVTHAAWPHLREQQFGRIIMTSSAAGLYGNFGQANYSAAKLAQLGLARTLSIEGAKYNILTNTVVPMAGSRMTETILPPEVVEALKPEYISPLVAYLCHPSTRENNALFEAGAGWISRLRLERTQGAFFDIKQGFSPEDVAAQWETISDWSDASHPASVQDSFGPIMTNIQKANDDNDA